jgi:hypothetical protein
VKVARQYGKDRIVGKALEKFANVGDPEGTFEAGANLLQTFGKTQS